jgi:hypothetical protein
MGSDPDKSDDERYRPIPILRRLDGKEPAVNFNLKERELFHEDDCEDRSGCRV